MTRSVADMRTDAIEQTRRAADEVERRIESDYGKDVDAALAPMTATGVQHRMTRQAIMRAISKAVVVEVDRARGRTPSQHYGRHVMGDMIDWFVEHDKITGSYWINGSVIEQSGAPHYRQVLSIDAITFGAHGYVESGTKRLSLGPPAKEAVRSIPAAFPSIAAPAGGRTPNHGEVPQSGHGSPETWRDSDARRPLRPGERQQHDDPGGEESPEGDLPRNATDDRG